MDGERHFAQGPELIFQAGVKRPILYFLVGGLLLVGLDAWRRLPVQPAAETAAAVRQPIVVTSKRVGQLRTDFAAAAGRVPTPAEEQQQLKRWVEGEILYREALLRGMHVGDRSIQHRLVEKMRFLTTEEEVTDADLFQQVVELDLAHDDTVIRRILIHKLRLALMLSSRDYQPSDEDLKAYLHEHDSRYRQPARTTLAHVFFSHQQRGEKASNDATKALAQLQATNTRPADAPAHGDLFALGHTFTQRSQTSLEKTFGAGFAAKAIASPSGVWSGPLRSAYGYHLVRISGLRSAQLPDLESVRERLTAAMRTEQRDARFEAALQELLRVYPVRVEQADGSTRPLS